MQQVVLANGLVLALVDSGYLTLAVESILSFSLCLTLNHGRVTLDCTFVLKFFQNTKRLIPLVGSLSLGNLNWTLSLRVNRK